MDAQTNTFYAGYRHLKMNPPFGTLIPGYGPTFKRPASGIITDLYARCVALSDGENRAVIFNADALDMSPEGAKRVRELVSRRCGIPEEAVYFCCSHSHTAVWLSTDQYEKPGDFLPRVMQIFCDAAQMAIDDLKPCRILSARGEAKGVGYIRRYLMRDGTVKTNPKTMDPNIVRPAGTQDDEVRLIRLVREGAPEILLVNYGTHPDVIGGTLLCADWPGYVVDTLKAAFDGKIEAVMLTGAQGNSSHVDRQAAYEPGRKRLGVWYAKHMARQIAGEVLKIYDDAEPVAYGPVRGYFATAMADKNFATEEDYPVAQQIYDYVTAHNTGWNYNVPEELKKYNMSFRRAQRILRNRNKPDKIPVEISGLQAGDLALIGIAGEPFCEIGIRIKEESRMQMTFITCLTGGSRGYLPCASAYEGGGYESDSSLFAPTLEKELVDTAKKILDQMNETQAAFRL